MTDAMLGEELLLETRKIGAPMTLAVGTMNFGKRTAEPEATRIVQRALERGVTFFDTANAYSDGESERIVGRALGKDRARCTVATKVGFGRHAGRPEGLAPERVLVAIDESLERLGTDYADVYYLHVPDPRTPIDETLSAMKQIIDSGKARAWGVSNYASWQVLELMGAADRIGLRRPQICQQMYNALIRQLDVEYFKFAARFPIHTTVYNPLAGGLLVGRHREDGSTRGGSRFDKNKLYLGRYWSDTFFAATGELRAIADSAGLGLVELAYAWLRTRPGIDSVLVGPATSQHLDAAIDACNLPVSPDTVSRMDAAYTTMMGTDASYAR